MKIKAKLTLGVGSLFIMILILAALGTRYINTLKNDTENILVANYSTLEYSRNMLLALDESLEDKSALNKFDINLKKQQKNITEPGESEATELLTEHFSKLKSDTTTNLLHPLIRRDISEIMHLNMQAIQRKSNIAKETAKSSTLWIVLTGTVCFLIAFTLLINLPNNISRPIKELSESIKQVASRNYHQRVNFESHDEFGELAKSFNTMAEKLEEYSNSNLSDVLFEKKRIETLINNMRDPVIGLDEHMKILFVNNEALKILGMTSDQVMHQPAIEISLRNDLMRELIRNIKEDIKPDESSKKNSIKIFVDNKESYFDKDIVEIIIHPTGEKTKKLIGHVIMLKNVTHFKELDFAKTNFIATISHELKTPISSIKMSLKLLEKEAKQNMNTSQKELLESINEDSDRLLKITAELLNLSQVETGNVQLSIHASNPYSIADYAIDAVKIQAEQKKIVVRIEAEKDLPDVKADPEKTTWVLINFLTNAIRYSPDQSTIQVEIVQEGARIKYAVKDNGRGIEERYSKKIFDKYFQIPGSNKTGNGLGLAISKEFIDAQDGIIGVKSEFGIGSIFYFSLPMA